MISFKKDTSVLLLNLVVLVAVVGLVFAGKVTGTQALGFVGGLLLPTAFTARRKETTKKAVVVASIPIHESHEAPPTEPPKKDEPS